MKKIILCFFILDMQGSWALFGIKGACEGVFRKHSILFSNYDFKNPLSKTLMESYWLAQHLKFFDGQSKKEITKWEKGLKEMVELLEHSADPRSSAKISQLNISMDTLINKVPQIIEVVRKSPPESALSHRQTALAVMAVFAKLLPTALKESDQRQVHYERIHLILKEIENFEGRDELSSHFALYKINRAIEKWYSIKEFIRCKV